MTFEVTANLLETVMVKNCTVIREPLDLQFTAEGELIGRGQW
jgi:hypothetical protein